MTTDTTPTTMLPSRALHALPTAQVQSPATPPLEVKSVIDKLVQFVVKNGIKFEQKVKEKESNNKTFGFLHPWNPYNAYYKYCLEQVSPNSLSTRPSHFNTHRH
jgi:Surp module